LLLKLPIAQLLFPLGLENLSRGHHMAIMYGGQITLETCALVLIRTKVFVFVSRADSIDNTDYPEALI